MVAPAVTSNPAAVLNAAAAQTHSFEFVNSDASPCNWNITIDPDTGTFKADNIINGHIFEGTKEEFRNMLRGK